MVLLLLFYFGGTNHAFTRVAHSLFRLVPVQPHLTKTSQWSVYFVLMVTSKGFLLDPAFLHAISVRMSHLFFSFCFSPTEESSD